MYIGIRDQVEYLNGTFSSPLIPFDERYINSKIAYYRNGALEQRVDLPACEDKEDFNRKIKYSSELSEDDFDKMKCIPADSFSLYNDAESKVKNTISLIFEQCGGRYSSVFDEMNSIASELDEALVTS